MLAVNRPVTPKAHVSECNGADDMRRKCGGGDIPPKMISAAARELRLSPDEFAEAAGRINRPFANNHVR